jgi:hypothetical protein
MTTHDTFWARVDELLDAGRNPFDDPVLAENFLREPVLLDQLERLVEHLDLLAGVTLEPVVQSISSPGDSMPPPRVGHTVRRWAAAAILLLGLGAVTWLAWPRDTPAPRDGGQVVSELPLPRTRINSFHSSVRHQRRDAPLRPTPRTDDSSAPHPILVSWRQTWTTP